MELTDTTLQLTLGEDHQVTKTYQDAAAKVAPVVAIVSFASTVANPGAWEKGIDIACNYRFITDTAVDAINGKILGIECPVPADSGALKLVTIPVGEDATPEDIEKAAEALSEMGFDKEAVKQALTLPEENDEDEEPEPAEKPFSELSDEELDQKIEDISLTDEEWEALFQEVYDEFLQEMNDKGLIDPYDDIWDYEPFMPIEDFPEDGDELGFDDIANWAKPMEPYDDSSDTPDDEGESAQPGDDEGFDNSDGAEESQAPGTDEPYSGSMAKEYEQYIGTYEGITTTVLNGEELDPSNRKYICYEFNGIPLVDTRTGIDVKRINAGTIMHNGWSIEFDDATRDDLYADAGRRRHADDPF